MLRLAARRLAGVAPSQASHTRGFAIAAGSKLPSVELDLAAWPPTPFNIAERAAGKKVVIVGLPGAFTPT